MNQKAIFGCINSSLFSFPSAYLPASHLHLQAPFFLPWTPPPFRLTPALWEGALQLAEQSNRAHWTLLPEGQERRRWGGKGHSICRVVSSTLATADGQSDAPFGEGFTASSCPSSYIPRAWTVASPVKVITGDPLPSGWSSGSPTPPLFIFPSAGFPCPFGQASWTRTKRMPVTLSPVWSLLNTPPSQTQGTRAAASSLTHHLTGQWFLLPALDPLGRSHASIQKPFISAKSQGPVFLSPNLGSLFLHHPVMATRSSSVLWQLFLKKSSSSTSSHVSPTERLCLLILTRLNGCDQHRPSEIYKIGLRVPTWQNSLIFLTYSYILYPTSLFDQRVWMSRNRLQIPFVF